MHNCMIELRSRPRRFAPHFRFTETRIRQPLTASQRPIAMGIHGNNCGSEETDNFREIDLPVDLAALVALFLTSTFGNTTLSGHAVLTWD